MRMITITPMMIRTNTAMDTPTAIGIMVLAGVGTNGLVVGVDGWSELDV